MIDFALAALVVYRLARLIALDEGPAGVCLKFRAACGAYDLGPNGQPVTNLGRGVSCPHCVGFWLALIVALLMWPIGWQTVLYWLALAGAQSFLQEVGS